MNFGLVPAAPSMVSYPSQQSSVSTASSSIATASTETSATDSHSAADFAARPYNDPQASPFSLPPSLRARLGIKSATKIDSAPAPIPCRSRCYWGVLALPRSCSSANPPSRTSSSTLHPDRLASTSSAGIEALELIYADAAFQAHVGEDAADELMNKGYKFFNLLHPDDVKQAKEDMEDILGLSRNTFGSVIRCRFAKIKNIAGMVPQNNGHKSFQAWPNNEDDFETVDLVISHIGDSLALCFIHSVNDESPNDCDEHDKTEFSNWCGIPAQSFSAEEASKLWRQIYRRRGQLRGQAPPEHIFQILRLPQDGGDILFSWPAPRFFSSMPEDHQAAAAAAIVADSSLIQYQDGSYFADDYAALAQGLDKSLFALSDASTNCTRRLRAKHTLTTNGIVQTVESVVIGYGDIIIAMFTNVAPDRHNEHSATAALPGLNMQLPAFIPFPSDAHFAASVAAIAAQSQVALMSQSPTTLSPTLLKQTLSPTQGIAEHGTYPAIGHGNGFGGPFGALPHSAPAGAISFFPGTTPSNALLFQDSENSEIMTQSYGGKLPSRRSFDESALSARNRLLTTGSIDTAEDRRMSDTAAFAHRRTVTFNADYVGLSQHQQLSMDAASSMMDADPTSQRLRNPSYASFASSNFSQPLSTIDGSCDPLSASMTSNETMYSPRGSMKWGASSMAEFAGAAQATNRSDHRESFASATGLDAAAIAAAVSAAAAAGARRRTRQETWPLARITDESAPLPSALSISGSNIPEPASSRTRSSSAAVWQSDSAPMDPSSAAATAAAAAAVAAAAAANADSTSTANASTTALLLGDASNDPLHRLDAMSKPSAINFQYGTATNGRLAAELGPLDTTLGPFGGMAMQTSEVQQLTGTSGNGLIDNSFKPSTVKNVNGSGLFVTSFAPHCRALSVPGLGLSNGMVLTSEDGNNIGGDHQVHVQDHHHHAIDRQMHQQRLQIHHPHNLFTHNPFGPLTHGHQLGAPLKTCASCGTSNSPEWRKGPTGQKTLCNACGLRFSRSVTRAKKREEKRKASEPSLRRSSEVAAAATTAAAGAARAAAVFASSSATHRFGPSTP